MRFLVFILMAITLTPGYSFNAGEIWTPAKANKAITDIAITAIDGVPIGAVTPSTGGFTLVSINASGGSLPAGMSGKLQVVPANATSNIINGAASGDQHGLLLDARTSGNTFAVPTLNGANAALAGLQCHGWDGGYTTSKADMFFRTINAWVAGTDNSTQFVLALTPAGSVVRANVLTITSSLMTYIGKITATLGIDSTAIGGSTPSTGAFTTLGATGLVTLQYGTTTSPATFAGKLQMSHAGITSLTAGDCGIEFKCSTFGSGFGAKLVGYDDGTLVFANRSNNVAWSEVGRISSTGWQGAIGGTTPSTGVFSALQANGTTNIFNASAQITSADTNATLLILNNSSVGGKSWSINSTGSASGFGAGNLVFYDGAASRLMLTATGINNSPIGATTPSTGVFSALTAQAPIIHKNYTVATLPAVAGAQYGHAFVTDATQTLTAGIGAVVAGGGANIVPVISDGTNWRIG